MNSDQNALPNPVKVWRIDSAALTTGNLKPVNDEDTHYSITLTKSTQIDQLLKDINNAAGWAKVRVAFCWCECVANGYCFQLTSRLPERLGKVIPGCEPAKNPSRHSPMRL